jgi:DNA-binding transcriptional regulator YiaG
MRKATQTARTATPKRAGKHGLMSTVGRVDRLAGFDVKEFCESYGVNQDTFTRLTGFSPRAVAHWAQGRKPSTSTERRLAELRRLLNEMEAFVAKEDIGPWLRTPNPAFDGSTPLQVVERGEADRIWRMLYELESGEPG